MFVLIIRITPASLMALKADLTKSLPDVKSSHRVEALARGFGFQTYAAMRAAVAGEQVVLVTATGTSFSRYLSAHGFDSSPIPFYHAATRVALQAVLDKTPKLCVLGIGAGEPRRKPDGKFENAREHYARFLESRKEFMNPFVVEEFLRSLAFLARVQPTKTIRSEAHSYRLKHIAENYNCRYPEGMPLGPHYVANGAMIAAAIHAGFRYKTYVDALGWDVRNVDFNMSKAVIDDLDCEIRPNDAVAESRRWLEARRKQRRKISLSELRS